MLPRQQVVHFDMGVYAMVEWLSGAAGEWALGKTLDAGARILAGNKRGDTQFLNHDPKICSQFYHLEPPLGGHLPYTEIYNFSDVIKTGELKSVAITTNNDEFFKQPGDMEWALVRAQGYSEYRAAGHAKQA